MSGSAYPGPLTAQPKGREQVASLTCRHCGQRIAHGQVTGWYHDRTGLRDCLLEAEPPESATARRQA